MSTTGFRLSFSNNWVKGGWILDGSHMQPMKQGAFLSFVANGLWQLWKMRNSVHFNNLHVPTHILWRKTVALTIDYLKQPLHTSLRTEPIWVRWEHPPPGWFKLNTDGSFQGESGEGGASFIVRSDLGNPVLVGGKHIRAESAPQAEAVALRWALEEAKKKDLNNLIIECDSAAHHKKKGGSPLEITASISGHLCFFFDFCASFCHCYREANQQPIKR